MFPSIVPQMNASTATPESEDTKGASTMWEAEFEITPLDTNVELYMKYNISEDTRENMWGKYFSAAYDAQSKLTAFIQGDDWEFTTPFRFNYFLTDFQGNKIGGSSLLYSLDNIISFVESDRSHDDMHIAVKNKSQKGN